MTESTQDADKPLSAKDQLIATVVCAALGGICGYAASRAHGFWQTVAGAATLMFGIGFGASLMELFKALGRGAGRRTS